MCDATWEKEHIHNNYHSIGAWIVVRDINLQLIWTNNQTMDIYIKALGVDKLGQFFLLQPIYVYLIFRAWGGMQKQEAIIPTDRPNTI
mgnify:CR=1 FL=1